MSALRGRDVVAIGDLGRDEYDLILRTALQCERVADARTFAHLLDGDVLATIFLEPSTRTRLSFEAAMQKLGGGVITVAEPHSSSLAKGESLVDMVRVVEQYADVLVLRSPQIGAARLAADAAHIPVLNAGDGSDEHPTQALLDLYTIQKERGCLDGLTVAFVGDLRFGRTVHSLVTALLPYRPTIVPVAPRGLELPDDLEKAASERANLVRGASLTEALSVADVIYVTRVQRERFSNAEEYEALKTTYRLDRQLVERTGCRGTILHPLPRLSELSEDLDTLPTAAYIRQAGNGIWVRQALLGLVLGRL